MPLIMRWPGHIRPGVRSSAMVQALDYAPTFCDVAGVNTKETMNTFQGRSLTPPVSYTHLSRLPPLLHERKRRHERGERPP